MRTKTTEILGRDDTSTKPQGTRRSGYQELGDYHCEDCIHKTAPNQPYCVHPEVIADPEMKERLVQIDGKTVARVNLKHGCCEFVNQHGHKPESDSSEYREVYLKRKAQE